MDKVEQAIVERVSRDAAAWFPGTPPHPTVHLGTLSVRRRSQVYAVSLGEPTATPVLVAKVRREHSALAGGRGGPPQRPTLAPALADEKELTAREYAGLQLLEATFSDGDPRFGAIRPLAHLEAHHTILMEYVRGKPVRALILRSSRLSPARLRRRVGPTPESVLPMVGAWLRRFHDASTAASYPARHATGSDLVAQFCALEEFLGRLLGRRFGALAGAGSGLAAEVFPAGALPLVVGHGDFAPRNVLVSGAGRLVVLDPLVRWAVPAQEDLCRFLVGLQLLGLQLHTHGAAFSTATLEHWERLLIASYYGTGVPVAALRCYQLLILLDKWSALAESAGAGNLRTGVRRLSLDAATGYVRAQAERLVTLARSADG